MNFFIKFVPYVPNDSQVYRLPIRAVDWFEAEKIAYELAIILDADKTDSYNPAHGVSVFEKSEGDTVLYTFYVVEE